MRSVRCAARVLQCICVAVHDHADFIGNPAFARMHLAGFRDISVILG